jgi:hypothetical protein
MVEKSLLNLPKMLNPKGLFRCLCQKNSLKLVKSAHKRPVKWPRKVCMALPILHRWWDIS